MSAAVVLIGLSGSGKSTVGKLLAARICLPFLDTDRLIEQRTGRSIADLFAHDGEERFRSLEAAIVADACRQTAVVATGGGAVLRDDNRAAMRAGNLVVWLDPPHSILERRLAAHQQGEVRPLLAGDLGERLRRLDAARRHLYVQTAHTRIGLSHNGLSGSHQIAVVLASAYREWQAKEDTG